jgi:hypothetical protein
MSSEQTGGVLADAPPPKWSGSSKPTATAGQHFFEASAMRFFNSTIYPRVIGGRYFITGERFDEHHPERFTIRFALDNGHIETVATSRHSPPTRTPNMP